MCTDWFKDFVRPRDGAAFAHKLIVICGARAGNLAVQGEEEARCCST
jgi:hypothetical protein